MSSTKGYSSDQLQEVSSWLHDERQCVSIGAVSRNTGLSRTQAQALLREAASKGDYQVTNVVVSEEEEKYGEEAVTTTVFKLASKPFSSQDASTSDHLFAMCLCQNEQATESLSAAHEREMAQLRDFVADNQLRYVASSDCNADQITPTAQVAEQMKHTARPDAVVVTESSRPAPKKKTTSAASFFAKKENGALQKKSSKKSASTASKKSTSTTSMGTKKTSLSQRKTENEKENHRATASQKKKIGNADDFVGDDESSDDDDDDEDHMDEDPHDDPMEVEEEIVPEPRPRKKVARKTRPPPVEEDPVEPEEAEDDDSVQEVSGAMDAFATKATKTTKTSATTGHRRRRKKLVEKTSKDANGYLHTATEEVWEDIPSDEEDKMTLSRPAVPKRAAARAPAKKKQTGKKSMKQGNLMGFFVKK